jgi:hypothetical protein
MCCGFIQNPHMSHNGFSMDGALVGERVMVHPQPITEL